MKFAPLYDYVLLRGLDGEAKSAGGLFVPEVAQNRMRAEVVAAGPGRPLADGNTVPMSVKAGDTVLLQRYDALDVPIEGEKLRLCRETDIIGIFR